ncbi:MAG: cytochrome c biogenesis protein CcsA [Planctomycetota bacterium]|nr:cytochrome c biogenesis protein CcsA [Planctomycetota bacterium]
MNGFVQAATVLLPTAYLVTAVLFGMAFAGERQPASAARLRRIALALTLLLHGGMLVGRGMVAGTFPVSGVWVTVSATSFVVAALFALMNVRDRVASVGAVVFLTVALLQTAASAFGPVRAVPLPPVDSFGIVHVVTVTLASAAVILSGLFGVLHLWLLRQMRGKRFGPVYRELPDLEQLVRLNRRAALFGFVMLAAGLNLGIGLAHARGIDGFGYTDPSVLLTIAIWIHFGLIAFSKHIPGISARHASVAAIAGLVVLLITIGLTFLPAVPFHVVG